MRNAGGENMYVALLHQMSRAYPVCFAAVPFVGGFEFSSKVVKTSRLGTSTACWAGFHQRWDGTIMKLLDGPHFAWPPS
ncbi:hypothetical protein CK203_083852 [Vitis vinifera]|uniref:Uncharacterized protein n=1 Tax=Vitis vinifera TaxID=29760 RepID=A0A438BUF1_VITVI|nr:hypothetical protein CK203_083852 [Vitis vinifera]